MGDLVQHRQADFLAQLVRVGEIFQQGLGEYGNLIGQHGWIERRAIGQGRALVEAIQRIFARVEAFGPQEFFARPLFDDDFDVAQLFAKFSGQSVDHPNDFVSDIAVIQRS